MASELRLYRNLAIPLLGSRLARPTGMATRTRFIDDRVLEAIDSGVSQVVLVGAGYDGRALRFSDAAVRWIEIDHPATQADKRQRLSNVAAKAGGITFVGIDLLKGDLGPELAEAGHNPLEPTLWVCEGLLPYLPKTAIAALFTTLRTRSSERSALVCNVLVNDGHRATARWLRKSVDAILVAIGERRLSEFRSGDIERCFRDADWQPELELSTTPGRTDGTHLLPIMAVPSEPSSRSRGSKLEPNSLSPDGTP